MANEYLVSHCYDTMSTEYRHVDRIGSGHGAMRHLMDTRSKIRVQIKKSISGYFYFNRLKSQPNIQASHDRWFQCCTSTSPGCEFTCVYVFITVLIYYLFSCLINFILPFIFLLCSCWCIPVDVGSLKLMPSFCAYPF